MEHILITDLIMLVSERALDVYEVYNALIYEALSINFLFYC